jgi:hypothetical protein
MFRLIFSLIGVILLGLGSGYFMWGSRVAHLTDSLNTMVLEQETLRSRLLAGRGRPAPAVGDGDSPEPSEAGDDVFGGETTLKQSIGALKDEVVFQAKLIDEQTRLMNRILEDSEKPDTASLAACQTAGQALASQLQVCRSGGGQARPGYAPGAPAPSAIPIPVPNGQPGGLAPPPPGPRY